MKIRSFDQTIVFRLSANLFVDSIQMLFFADEMQAEFFRNQRLKEMSNCFQFFERIDLMRIFLPFFEYDYIFFPRIMLFNGDTVTVIFYEVKFSHNIG